MSSLRWLFAMGIPVCLLLPGAVSPENWALAREKQDKGTAGKRPSLMRADFKIEGASCASCIRRISHTLASTNGVLKADVSIMRPFWAVVIYDRNKTSIDKLKKAVDKEHVTFVDLEQSPVLAVPVVLIPKGLTSSPPLKD